jgi:hypothetical protein
MKCEKCGNDVRFFKKEIKVSLYTIGVPYIFNPKDFEEMDKVNKTEYFCLECDKEMTNPLKEN